MLKFFNINLEYISRYAYMYVCMFFDIKDGLLNVYIYAFTRYYIYVNCIP